MTVTEYESISLNINNYSSKCFNKLFLVLCQGPEYAWSSDMFDRLLKIPQVLNMLGFWKWHGCTCTAYTESWVCPNMTQYATIMPLYASLCLNFPPYFWTCLNIGLNMTEYWWMSLIISENAWKNCSDYASVLNMPHYIRNITGF